MLEEEELTVRGKAAAGRILDEEAGGVDSVQVSRLRD